MKHILVTIDFNKKEELLINQAMQLAKAFDSTIWLMHIAAPNPDFVGFDIGPQYIRDTRAKELRDEHRKLQAYSNSMKDQGINSEGLLVQGATIEMIMEESKKLNVDLIVTGRNHHGFFYNAFIGNTSSEIIEQAKIPVLIVPLD